MHIHLGIKADGLDFSHLGGHHVVVNDKSKPLDAPGNVCMISIATVWSPEMAPDGYHCVHCYTMEPYDGWTELKNSDRKAYEQKKKEKCGRRQDLNQICQNRKAFVEIQPACRP